MAAPSGLLTRERNLLLALLGALALLGWALVLWQSMAMSGEMASPTMGLDAPLFLATWIAMMVAMMFPTAAPMILTFASVSAGKRARGQAYVPTWVFVGAYLLVWTAFGVAAYLLALGAQAVSTASPWLMANAARLGGGILVLAGLYQLSPLKWACLWRCRTPLTWVLHSWRDGYGGAFRMGLEHGLYCLGCCWLLFVLLFPLGIMNVGAMAALTALIFAEKSLPHGRRIGQVAGLALLAYGGLVLLVPELLPTYMPSGMELPRDVPLPSSTPMPGDMPTPLSTPVAPSGPPPTAPMPPGMPGM
jgi:predicted metal-binding membrane protein